MRGNRRDFGTASAIRKSRKRNIIRDRDDGWSGGVRCVCVVFCLLFGGCRPGGFEVFIVFTVRVRERLMKYVCSWGLRGGVEVVVWG